MFIRTGVALNATLALVLLCTSGSAHAAPLTIRGEGIDRGTGSLLTVTGPVASGVFTKAISPRSHGSNQTTGTAFEFNPRLGSLLETIVGVETEASRTFFGSAPFVHSNFHESFGLSPALNGDVVIPVEVTSDLTQVPYAAPGSTQGSETTFRLGFRVDLSSFGIPDIQPTPPPYADVFRVLCGSFPCAMAGGWSVTFRLVSEMTYEPKSTKEYVIDALNATGASGWEAQRAYYDVIELRQWDATTSSQNLALRDAEYWLRGFWAATAGAVGSNEDWRDSLSRAGPPAAFGYNAKKFLDRVWCRVFRCEPDTALPGAPVGGLLPFWDGWNGGKSGKTLEQAVRDFGFNFSPPLTPWGDTALSPILPVHTAQIAEAGNQADLAVLLFEVNDPARLYYIDPDGARTLAWAVSDNSIRGFVVPVLDGQPSMTFTVGFADQSANVPSGHYFDFSKYSSSGVDSFSLASDDPAFSALGHFVIGLQFDRSALTTILTASLREAAVSSDDAIEYYHAAFNHYFVTSLATEKTALDSGMLQGWARTGRSFKTYPPNTQGAANVCRFFSAVFAPKSSHFYTPFTSECAAVQQSSNWTYEGEVFGVHLPDGMGRCSTGAVPLYRLYNDGKSGAPNHRYTTDADIRSTMISQGWVPEGVGSDGIIACVPH